jgi:hypothetical protein
VASRQEEKESSEFQMNRSKEVFHDMHLSCAATKSTQLKMGMKF